MKVVANRSSLPGAILLGLASSLYLFFGLFFVVGSLAFHEELAHVYGHSMGSHDLTQSIHLVMGLGALVVAWVGVYGMRAWLRDQDFRDGFVAAVALTSFSCMFGLMPAVRSVPVFVSGLALMVVSIAAFLVVLQGWSE